VFKVVYGMIKVCICLWSMFDSSISRGICNVKSENSSMFAVNWDYLFTLRAILWKKKWIIYCIQKRSRFWTATLYQCNENITFLNVYRQKNSIRIKVLYFEVKSCLEHEKYLYCKVFQAKVIYSY